MNSQVAVRGTRLSVGVLLLALVVMAFTAAVALAAIVRGDGTLVGSTGNDTITAGNAPGDYPHGLPSADYCQHGPSGIFGTDNITAGGGRDTVYGNGGKNNITLGNGEDTVFAFGGPNRVTVGNGQDTISRNCTVKFVPQQPVPSQAGSRRHLAKTASKKTA